MKSLVDVGLESGDDSSHRRLTRWTASIGINFTTLIIPLLLLCNIMLCYSVFRVKGTTGETKVSADHSDDAVKSDKKYYVRTLCMELLLNRGPENPVDAAQGRP